MSFLLITKQHFFLKSILQLFSALNFFFLIVSCLEHVCCFVRIWFFVQNSGVFFAQNSIFCSKFDTFLLKIQCPIRRFRPPANRLPAGTCRSWTHRLTNESEENYQNIWIKFRLTEKSWIKFSYYPFDRKSNFARTRMKLILFSKKWTYYSFIQASLSSSLKVEKFLRRECRENHLNP